MQRGGRGRRLNDQEIKSSSKLFDCVVSDDAHDDAAADHTSIDRSIDAPAAAAAAVSTA
jgi:hypothetical protein